MAFCRASVCDAFKFSVLASDWSFFSETLFGIESNAAVEALVKKTGGGGGGGGGRRGPLILMFKGVEILFADPCTING